MQLAEANNNNLEKKNRSYSYSGFIKKKKNARVNVILYVRLSEVDTLGTLSLWLLLLC